MELRRCWVPALIVLLLVFVLAGCIPVEKAPIYFSIVEYNSGPAVEGVKVTVFDAETGKRLGWGTSDECGVAQVEIPVTDLAKRVNVRFEKSGYALSEVRSLKAEDALESPYEVMVRKAILNDDPSTQELPEIDVEFLDLDDTPLDPSATITDDFKVKISVTSENHVSIIYAALGKVPGSSFMTGERGYESDATSAEFEISISGFSSETALHVVVYDYNDNRVDQLFYLNILAEEPATDVVMYEPLRWSEYGYTNLDAYTRRGGVEFYSFDKIAEKLGKRVPRNFGNARSPLAAPKDCNLWVEVWWIDWATAQYYGWIDSDVVEPDGYNIYRSFDGEKYEKIGFVSESYAAYNGVYRDKSALLEPGEKVYYAVSAVYGTEESTPATLGSVVLLGAFNVDLMEPYEGQTGVSRNPVFKWKPTVELTSEEGTVTYEYILWIYDLVQSENHIIPGYVDASGLNAFVFSSEGAETMAATFTGNETEPTLGYDWFVYSGGWYYYPEKKLEPNKTYSWAVDLAYAYVQDDDSSAWSIAVDQGWGVDYFGVDADDFVEFTTGDE